MPKIYGVTQAIRALHDRKRAGASGLDRAGFTEP
jgi:hypothetical protein